MIVHLISAVDNLRDNITSLRLVVDALHEKEHMLARDWIESAYRGLLNETVYKDLDWQMIAKENLETISRADAIIADISSDSTAVGYQIATAVQQKKPTLIILKEGLVAPPFTWNIPSTFLSKVEYNEGNIKEKITPFLEENNITTKDLRFNFFIDRHIYNYLRWTSAKTGKTKAEILRDLVQKEINKENT